MSTPMPAARKTDPVAHASVKGKVLGAVAGAALAGLFIGAVIFSGGTVALLAGATYVVSGASMGKTVGGWVDDSSPPNVDEKIEHGAEHVFTNNLRSAKAHPDTKVDKHNPDWVCEGADHVYIEGWNAGRKGDKTSCGGTVHAGSPDTHIGGEPVRAPGAPGGDIDEDHGTAYKIFDNGLSIAGLVLGGLSAKSWADRASLAVDVADYLGIVPESVSDWLWVKDVKGLGDVPGLDSIPVRR